MEDLTSVLKTPGAAAVISGFFALLGLTIGLWLQPHIHRRIRQEQEQEEEKKQWVTRGRELTAELTRLLWGGFSDGFMERMGEQAATTWLQEMERPLMMMARFAPSQELRERARATWLEFRKLTDTTVWLLRNPGHARATEVSTRREESYGEASYALDRLIESLGGPKAPNREEYPLTLRTDRDRTSPEQ